MVVTIRTQKLGEGMVDEGVHIGEEGCAIWGIKDGYDDGMAVYVGICNQGVAGGVGEARFAADYHFVKFGLVIAD